MASIRRMTESRKREIRRRTLKKQRRMDRRLFTIHNFIEAYASIREPATKMVKAQQGVNQALQKKLLGYSCTIVIDEFAFVAE